MSLRPPEDGQSFESLDDLVIRVNEHAAPQGYAIVLRTKKSKLGIRRKAWLICDRGGKPQGPQGQERRHTSSRCIECPFLLTAKRMEEDGGAWILEVVNEEHNHSSSLAGAHPVHRRMAMTAEVKGEISR